MKKILIIKTPKAPKSKSLSPKNSVAENQKGSRRLFAAQSLLLAGLVISRASSALAAESNLVVNGDFEQPGTQCGLWLSVPEGSGFITGWNVNVPSTSNANGGCNSFPGYSHSVDLLVNPGGNYVHTGSQAVDLAGTFSTPGDSIYQDVPTRPGRIYTLTFYTSSNGDPKVNGLTVEWDDAPIATITTPPLGEWNVHTFSVVASSELTRLRFVDNIAGGQGPLLDTVSLVDLGDHEAPVVSSPPSITVPATSVPPAASSVAEFTAQGGSITDNQDPNPSVVSSDGLSGSCPALITRTYTVTDAAGNASQCQQLITVENLFATDGVVWYPPLARFDTEPGANVTPKYVFNRGCTIPVKIRVQGCDGTDLTRNGQIIGTLEVLPVSNWQDLSVGDPLPIDFKGMGGVDGLMEKAGGFLRYNLDTRNLPRNTRCFLLKATITNVATGESLSESLPIQCH